VAGGHDEGGDIFGYRRSAADDRVGAYPRELMNPRKPADDGEVLNVDVSGKVCRVGHDDVIAQLAVMGDMAVRHQQVVIADDGDADVGAGRPINRNVFPDRVMIADNDPRLLASELEILGGAAERCELRDSAFLTDIGMGFDDYVGADTGIFPDRYIGTDNRIRPDFNPFGERGAGGDNRGGVDLHIGSFFVFSSRRSTRRLRAANASRISGSFGRQAPIFNHSR
jgi:hypothetical protein